MSTALPAGTRRVRLSEGNWIVNAAGELCGRVTDGGEVVLLPRYSTDTSGNVTGLVGPDGTIALPLVAGLSDTSSAAIATANIASLQYALDNGSLAQLLTPGTYEINGTIEIGSGQSLITGPGATLKQRASTNLLMVGNTGLTQTPATVTVTWSAGNQASVAYTAHGLVAGDVVVLQGATPAAWNDVYRIAAVTDADNFIVQTEFLPTASPTGTITCYVCDRNITVDVALDYNYANNPSAAAGVNRHAAAFAFIADSTIRVHASNLYKFGVNLAGALNCRVEVVGVAAGDIFKGYGPMRDCVAVVGGDSKDDCASFQALEPAAFIAYMPCQGPIKNSSIQKASVVSAGNASSGAFVVYGDGTYNIDQIAFENFNVYNHNDGPTVAIKNGTGLTAAVGQIGRVTLRNGRISAKAGYYAAVVSCNMDKLVIDNVDMLGGDITTNRFRLENTSTIRHLVFKNLRMDLSDYSSSAFIFNLNGIAYLAEFDNCTFFGSSANKSARLVTVGTTGVRNVIFRNCEAENIDQILTLSASAAVAPRIGIVGGRFKTVASGLVLNTSATVDLVDSEFDAMTNGVVRPVNAAAVVTVYERGSTFASATPIVCSSSGTANPKSPTLPVDIGGTGILNTAGNMALHTGSTRGSIVTGRPAVANGTAWKDMTDLTLTF